MQTPRSRSNQSRTWTERPERKPGSDGPVYITEEGLGRLREQLAKLKASLPELISETEKAASYGDRSENFEYKDAKANLRRTKGQILNIEYKIKMATIIKIGPHPSGTVQLGSTVVLDVKGEQKVFQIVGPHETNPAKGRISHESPLGAALLNHKKGDIVTCKTENGSRAYHIAEVR